MATYVASIHLRPMEVSDEQGILYLRSALGVRKSRWCVGVEMASGDNLRGAGRNNICNR